MSPTVDGSPSAQLTVLSTGPLATVQDLGRTGYAEVGVPRSGAADRGALRLANRLVGNPEHLASLEITLGGFAARAIGDVTVAATGADSQLLVDDAPTGHNATLTLRDGQVLQVTSPTQGCRTYLAVRGGIDGELILGSRSTDTLSGLGPPALAAGDVIAIGGFRADWPTTQSAPQRGALAEVVVLTAAPGPRADRLVDADALFAGSWQVSSTSNRVGVRLDRAHGPLLAHLPNLPELLSEGIAHGSVQVPPSGQPVLFGPDHPVTGGYPVVAVLTADSIDQAGQLTPGTVVRLRRVD